MARKKKQKPKTKAGKQKKFSKVMREFSKGGLKHGSKKGPEVTDPKVAKAIAASESGMPKKKKGRRKKAT